MFFSGMDFILLLSFALLGAFIKLIDDTFDKGLYRKGIGYGLTLPAVALWIYLMGISSYSATILGAVFLGVIIAGKVDNPAFGISAIIIFFAFILNFNTPILWPYLIFMTVLAVLDEKGNDRADAKTAGVKWVNLLKYRFSMKIGIFILVFFGIFPWIYLFSFLAFDLAYDVVGYFGEKKQN